MTRAKFAPNPQQLLTDAAGPGNAYYAYYYEPDGAFSTQKTVYKDAAKSTSWTQPVTVGADGRPVGADVFLDGDYDRRIYDSNDNLIRSEQNIGDTWSAVSSDLSENLLSNASFDIAGSSGTFENWTDTDSGSVISRDTSDSYHGVACVKFTSSANNADYVTSDAFPVSPGKDLLVSFYVKASNASAYPVVNVNWLTAAQSSISTETIYTSNAGLSPTSWDLVQGILANPPSTARYAKLIVYGNSQATGYTVQFDGFEVRAIGKYPNGAPYNAPIGLLLSRDSGDTDHDIKITAGAVRDENNAYDMILPDDLVKRMDAAFDEGTGNGGASSGFSLPASDIYAVWLIMNSSTGHVDAMASTSYTSPTMPSGYDVKRYLGTISTDSSNNNVDFIHRGRYFYWKDPITDITDSSITDDTPETGTFSLPPYARGFFSVYWNYGSGQAAEMAIRMGPTDFGTNGMETFRLDPTSATIDEVTVFMNVPVDVSQQADYAVNDDSAGALTGTLTIYTRGCEDMIRDYPL